MVHMNGMEMFMMDIIEWSPSAIYRPLGGTSNSCYPPTNIHTYTQGRLVYDMNLLGYLVDGQLREDRWGVWDTHWVR